VRNGEAEKFSSKRKAMIELKSNALDELEKSIQELANISAKPVLTKRDEQRQGSLMAIISGLKAGASVAELRQWQRNRLLREAGLPRDPERARGRLDEQTEAEWRTFIATGYCDATRIPKDGERRDITSGSEAGQQSISFTQLTTGGAFVPVGLSPRSWEIMRLADDICDPRFSYVCETELGDTTTFPVIDDVSISSQFIGETVQGTPTPISNFGVVELKAWSARSLPIPFTMELEQDSGFPLGAVIEKAIAGRLARGVGKSYITGSGVNQPLGLITAIIAAGISPQIATGAASNDGGAETAATSVGTQDLVTLKHSIDPSYRRNGVWYMSDGTLQKIEALLDKNGHPVVKWGGHESGVTGSDGIVQYILGRPVAVCPSFPNVASGNNCVAFGDPSYFVTRRVPSSFLIRRYSQLPQLVERGMVALEGWLRTDSALIATNLSYAPFALLQSHS
jgi:HK97 family phage major capsid protein